MPASQLDQSDNRRLGAVERVRGALLLVRLAIVYLFAPSRTEDRLHEALVLRKAARFISAGVRPFEVERWHRQSVQPEWEHDSASHEGQ